jgi:hypothetical protein
MAVEFKVTVQNTPGTLARLGMLLGDAHVNIEAIQGTSREGKGFIQFVPKEADKARCSWTGASSNAASKRRRAVRLAPSRSGGPPHEPTYFVISLYFVPREALN